MHIGVCLCVLKRFILHDVLRLFFLLPGVSSVLVLFYSTFEPGARCASSGSSTSNGAGATRLCADSRQSHQKTSKGKASAHPPPPFLPGKDPTRRTTSDPFTHTPGEALAVDGFDAADCPLERLRERTDSTHARGK